MLLRKATTVFGRVSYASCNQPMIAAWHWTLMVEQSISIYMIYSGHIFPENNMIEHVLYRLVCQNQNFQPQIFMDSSTRFFWEPPTRRKCPATWWAGGWIIV